MGLDQVILGQTAGNTESFFCSIKEEILSGEISLLKFFLKETKYQLHFSPEIFSFVLGLVSRNIL